MFLEDCRCRLVEIGLTKFDAKLLAAAVQTNLSGNDDETSQDLDAMLGSLSCEVMNLSQFWS